MLATWPASLPQAMLLQHNEGAPSNVSAFQPMVGEPALFQTGSSRARAVSGSLRISDVQRATFLTFYETTLSMGTRQFEWTSDSFDGETWRLQFAEDGAYTLIAQAAGWILQVSLMMVRRVS